MIKRFISYLRVHTKLPRTWQINRHPGMGEDIELMQTRPIRPTTIGRSLRAPGGVIAVHVRELR